MSFNIARNPYYRESYKFAANHTLGGYVPPSYNKLRTTLLKQERVHVESLLDRMKSVWAEKGLPYVLMVGLMHKEGHSLTLLLFLKVNQCFYELLLLQVKRRRKSILQRS
jgi:hypothetical protein